MKPYILSLFLLVSLLHTEQIQSQHSVAREWNEATLEAIRNDFARPTVHARNLFHTTMAMYDAWAIYDDIAETFFLGKSLNGYPCLLDGEVIYPNDPAIIKSLREETISYAMYRIISYRYKDSPKWDETKHIIDSLFIKFNYDPTNTSSSNYLESPAALGNYIAEQVIQYGNFDGSNELDTFKNQYYIPSNNSLSPDLPGNPNIEDPNRWQPLTLDVFIDQAGNRIEGPTPDFLGPEWGNVGPFALDENVLQNYVVGSDIYKVYHDPGTPPKYTLFNTGNENDLYTQAFSMVSVWSSHLDPSDSVRWDISPKAIGNNSNYPSDFNAHDSFYNFLDGGDKSPGHSINPITGEPYESQFKLRGDYSRVLAEFWADGPDSETPPGHWFSILNYVNDHPLFEKRYQGIGPILDDLEWDVKTYFMLGGTMHDAAISAWGAKGYYDYIRPISALRFLASVGQSSAPEKPNYNPEGIELIDGIIEQVEPGDPLSGLINQHLWKIKVKAWGGPDFISDPTTDVAGVHWILLENWWPYQRPTFITPPFAGYVSGHSTFSRAAADLFTLFTGSKYFPGGMGEFVIPKDSFLVFEKGPSEDMTLQWATYQDASDQSSLSRIWGGIHPSIDDLPGRLMGVEIAINAFNKADPYFSGFVSQQNVLNDIPIEIFPNPISDHIVQIKCGKIALNSDIKFYNVQGQLVSHQRLDLSQGINTLEISDQLQNGIYFLKIEQAQINQFKKVMILR